MDKRLVLLSASWVPCPLTVRPMKQKTHAHQTASAASRTITCNETYQGHLDGLRRGYESIEEVDSINGSYERLHLSTTA